MKRIELIGLGNPLMKDEGIGCRLVSELEHLLATKNRGALSCLHLRDLGTSAAQILHAIADQDQVIFIDCAFMGEAPGTIRKFKPEEVHSQKALANLSLHEGDLFRTLELSKQLGEYPHSILIYGIEPLEVTPGNEISSLLEEKLPEYLGILMDELNSLTKHLQR